MNLKTHSRQLFFFLISFLLTAAAQPDWSPAACALTACLSYAFFWKGMLLFKRRLHRFYYASIWFALVMGVHLNWFLSDRYVGIYIYFFLMILLAGLGIQFGCISLLINEKSLGMIQMIGTAGGWTLLEWSRLHILSGFSWDPMGLSLSGSIVGMQMASVFGIYGLSFWVFFTNLTALRLFVNRSWSNALLWSILLLTPYVFGWLKCSYHEKAMSLCQAPSLNALLVQTSLYPEEKVAISGSVPLDPQTQWVRILKLLKPYFKEKNDLIVLPEGTVPYGTNFPLYTAVSVLQIFKDFFPSYTVPSSSYMNKMGNGFWAETLAKAAQSCVVVGLEDAEWDAVSKSFHAYNAAFLYHPTQPKQRYEKRILVPMGEYIPFNWCKKILSKYGISDSYLPGAEAKVFQTERIPLSISVCYEETYGNLIREGRSKGAGVLINISNDVWYPSSRLPSVHYHHGRLRAVENGVPMLRTCNTGVTCGIDALGRTCAMLPFETSIKPSIPAVLRVSLPLYSYSTLYTVFGDSIILYFSASFFAFFIFGLLKQRISI